MNTHTPAYVSPDQVSLLAQTNARGLTLGAIAYLQRQGLAVRPYFEFIGQQFTALWPDHLPADEAAEAIALNMVSAGAQLISLVGDATQAEIVLEGWPGFLGSDLFELADEDADQALAIFRPIAAHMGFEFTWRRDGQQIVAVIAR